MRLNTTPENTPTCKWKFNDSKWESLNSDIASSASVITDIPMSQPATKYNALHSAIMPSSDKCFGVQAKTANKEREKP